MENNHVKFAEYVIANWGGGVGTSFDDVNCENECERLKREYESKGITKPTLRGYMLEIAGDRINTKDPKSLNLKATAYLWAGANCRRKAIEATIEYLQGDIWCEHGNFYKEKRGNHSCFMWADLGKAYISEKEFDKAIAACEKAEILYHEYHFDKKRPWHGMSFSTAEAYMKAGEHNKAVSVLETAREKYIKALNNPITLQEERDCNNIGVYDERIREYKQRRLHDMLCKQIPKSAPKSFSGYMKMKNAKTDNWLKLVDKAKAVGIDL